MGRTYTATSSSSGSSGADSNRSSRSNGSRGTYDTDVTDYSDSITPDTKSPQKTRTSPAYTHELVEDPVEISPRDSFATYASTVEYEDETAPKRKGPYPSRRYQCYEPDATPASTHEFSRLFPSNRRFMIQHDDTTSDGNMQLRLDTEVSSTPTRRTKKVTLFHLRMKDLREREFSLRRYCRESGREVASAKKRYIKSTSSTPVSQTGQSPKSFSNALQTLSQKSNRPYRADSGYASEEDEEEDERQIQEVLRTITASPEDVISTPTESIRLDFSNYSQVILERQKNGNSREYGFEYWGHNYRWKREKHHDNGELVYSYELYREGSRKRVAVIMPDALSNEEAQWESKQGSWIPACSMRLLQADVSDHLGDVIVTTGLVSLTDDCIRRHFPGADGKY